MARRGNERTRERAEKNVYRKVETSIFLVSDYEIKVTPFHPLLSASFLPSLPTFGSPLPPLTRSLSLSLRPSPLSNSSLSFSFHLPVSLLFHIFHVSECECASACVSIFELRMKPFCVRWRHLLGFHHLRSF